MKPVLAHWLTTPQMTVLSCLYHTDGQLALRGPDLRPAARLVELGYAQRVEHPWHQITKDGCEAFIQLLAQEDTREGAAARRLLDQRPRSAVTSP